MFGLLLKAVHLHIRSTALKRKHPGWGTRGIRMEVKCSRRKLSAKYIHRETTQQIARLQLLHAEKAGENILQDQSTTKQLSKIAPAPR